jgi:hypothetical protein
MIGIKLEEFDIFHTCRINIENLENWRDLPVKNNFQYLFIPFNVIQIKYFRVSMIGGDHR